MGLIICSNDKNLGAIHEKGVRKTNFERLFHIKCQHDISLATKHYIPTNENHIQQ